MLTDKYCKQYIEIGTRGYKKNFMLKSAGHEILNA